MKTIAELRKEYTLHGLSETDVTSDPFDQFQRWFQEAIAAGVTEPNAMTLATVSSTGRPSARIVLLKEVDPRGIVFFTNYQSRKGHELAANPYAALLFYWADLERQVRIEGYVAPIDATDSDSYFASRPRSAQIGAWASPQSQVIANREVLDQRAHDHAQAFADDHVPRPAHWGGYRLVPELFEFWQGRPSRLHDRICYQLNAAHTWTCVRLAP
jgi:pyridoxamine 5'-phosphate oxidase